MSRKEVGYQGGGIVVPPPSTYSTYISILLRSSIEERPSIQDDDGYGKWKMSRLFKRILLEAREKKKQQPSKVI